MTPWSHHDATVNGIRLHYVAAGDPDHPPVLLLHGFPEFWYGWRHQIGPLAAAGFRMIVPDLRGYNTSAKPKRVRDYRVESLVGDVLALIRQTGHQSGHQRAHLVGHDWGGVIAWYAAMADPSVINCLAVLNAPHPAAYVRELTKSSQLLRSWYAFFFQLPWLPEAVIRFDDYAMIRRLFHDAAARLGTFSEKDIDHYVQALARPGALTAALNYYRAAMRRGRRGALGAVRRIDIPTLLLWGERDRYLVPSLADGLTDWVSDLRVERLPNATHWVQHDEPERVSRFIVGFLAGHSMPVPAADRFVE